MMMMSKILIVTKSFSMFTGIDFHREGETWAKVFFHEEKRNMDEKKDYLFEIEIAKIYTL